MQFLRQSIPSWHCPDELVRLRLSGDTPGDCEWQRIRRVSGNALHAYLLTLDQTRWDTLSLHFMDSHHQLADALATAFLRGPWALEDLDQRACQLLGRRWRWIRSLAQRVIRNPWGNARPRHADVTAFIRMDAGFLRAWEKYDELCVVDWLVGQDRMLPADAAGAWQVPSICTARELANWLGIGLRELDWFADCRLLGYKRHRERLSHYWYRPLTKRFGRIRLVEVPKKRLKELHRKILTGILNYIPLHSAAHGFVRGASIRTFAAPHVGQRVVLRLDLRDFFPTISLAQIQALFRTVGYPESVADLLAGICTNATPAEIWRKASLSNKEVGREVEWRYAQPHLPQGAPSSPALANLCAYRLDCRLTGLAHASGAVYTRYADDLAFSGDEDFQRRVKRFRLHASAIAMEEGFAVHFRKTRVMHRGVRQQLAGIVVNEHVNVPRRDYDLLKAIITNCIRYGPANQNHEQHGDFRRHLEGRISFVQMVNPVRGRKLNDLFQRIAW